MASPRLPNPTTPPATCGSSATATRTAAATACRSWCIAATPMSATSSPRAFPSSTCAIPPRRKTVRYVAGASEHLDAASAGRRRPAARHPQQGHVRAARARRREELLQGLGRSSRQAGEPRRATGRRAWRSTTFPSPDEPRQIGFMPVEGTGLHRIWYVGGRWAYASALLDGFSDYILITIDMQDPKKPVARRQILAARHERRGRREGELADQERPLRPASPDRSRRHRLLQLARRLSRRGRRQGQGEPETASRTRSGPRRSAAARTTRCR